MGKQRRDTTTYTCDICQAEMIEQDTELPLPGGWHFAMEQVRTQSLTGLFVGPKCWAKLGESLPGPQLPPPQAQAKQSAKQVQ